MRVPLLSDRFLNKPGDGLIVEHAMVPHGLRCSLHPLGALQRLLGRLGGPWMQA